MTRAASDALDTPVKQSVCGWGQYIHDLHDVVIFVGRWLENTDADIDAQLCQQLSCVKQPHFLLLCALGLLLTRPGN